MFDVRMRSKFEKQLRPLASNLRRTGVTADHLTLLGIVMAIGSSIAIANGALRAALLLLFLTGVPDILDGAVAKASGTASPRGAFFDSVADRLTDCMLFAGVSWYLATIQPGRLAVLPLGIAGLSMLISYERAKAESLGFDGKGGIMERAERLMLLALALIFDSMMVPILWVMFVLSAVTAAQRFRQVWIQASAANGLAGKEHFRWRRRTARRTERAWARRDRIRRRPKSPS